jgi:drug/metabolite transporter (DMT)-like permease
MRTLADNPPRQSRINFYTAAVPLLTLLWGLNWPAVKIALGEIDPWTLRAIGLSSGGMILAGCALVRGDRLSVRRNHWLRLGVAGMLTIAAFNLLLGYAQLHAPTSRAAIVTFTMPVWTVLFARLFLGERLDRSRIIALAVGLAGLLALGWPLVRDGQFSIGLVYALLAGICFALGTVVTKRFPVEAPPITIATWQLLVGAACATVGVIAFEHGAVPSSISTATILAILYHVLFSQALAHILWFSALTRIPAGTAGLATLMVPAVGVYSATILLGEQPTAADYTGLALLVTAAFLALRPSNRVALHDGR